MTSDTNSPGDPLGIDADAAYQPGVCNIGPAEIRRRRQAGHIGTIATVVLLGLLLVFDVPPLARLLVAIPAMFAASGYLQAQLKFCAGFGSRGIFNFGDLGTTHEVADPEARRRDQAKAWRIMLASIAIGALVGVAAFVLPI